MSLEECLRTRRSCRTFDAEPLALADVSQLLWAAQGVTGLAGLRTAPSAGATYPIRTYLVAFEVTGARAGAYLYDPYPHTITLRKAGDLRDEFTAACQDQEEADTSAAAIILAANNGRMKREFGDAGPKLACLEAGHIAQNVCLQATALSLGTLTYGKTDAAAMSRLLELPDAEEPAYLVLAGPKLS